MRSLLAIGLMFGWTASAEAGPTTIYVPGTYEDGVYTHPHFVPPPAPASAVAKPRVPPADGRDLAPGVVDPTTLQSAPVSSS